MPPVTVRGMDLPPSLTGYAVPGHGIAPAEHLVEAPGFWPAYYLPVFDEFVAEPELFGADSADVDEAMSDLHCAEETWPAFRIPLAGGHVLWIVHRNFPGEAGTDYLVTHPDWDRHMDLASLDGHFSGPGLSWPELLAVAESAPAEGEGVRDPDLRLLLLLPAFGDADTPEAEAVERIAGALRAVGVAGEAASEVAEKLLDHQFWDPPTWTVPGAGPLSGGTSGPGVLPVCDGAWSPRTVQLGRGISATQAHALAAALTGQPVAR